MDDEQQIYTDEDLESFIPASSSEASYFEKAQDFRQLIKTLRIKYLGLKQVTKQDATNGSITTFWVKDKQKITGINKEGVEANIRFLETRLGKHSVLTSWKLERMMTVMLYDMMAWRDLLIINYERFEYTESTAIEMMALINDLLEFAYSRGVEDKERQTMRPVSQEIRRLLGLDQKQEQQMQGYPQPIGNKLREEAGTNY